VRAVAPAADIAAADRAEAADAEAADGADDALTLYCNINLCVRHPEFSS